jgi:hypothetical protein
MDRPKQIHCRLDGGRAAPIFVTDETIAADRWREKFYFLGSGMRSDKGRFISASSHVAKRAKARSKKDGAFTPVNRAATGNDNIHRRSLPVAGATNASFWLLRRLDVNQTGIGQSATFVGFLCKAIFSTPARVAAMQIPTDLIQIKTSTLVQRSLLRMQL